MAIPNPSRKHHHAVGDSKRVWLDAQSLKRTRERIVWGWRFVSISCAIANERTNRVPTSSDEETRSRSSSGEATDARSARNPSFPSPASNGVDERALCGMNARGTCLIVRQPLTRRRWARGHPSLVGRENGNHCGEEPCLLFLRGSDLGVRKNE